MGQKGFYYNNTSCIGCRTCQVACKDKNDLDVGIFFRRVRTFEVGAYPETKAYHYSSACNHCSDPKCVKGCPTGAMHFGEDGTVQPDADICIGCRYCTWNCPYGAPQYIEGKGTVSKCNSCIDLREEGGSPACVDACVMRCLKFGDLDELEAEYGPGLVQELPILPSADITQPSLLISPKACALNTAFEEREV